MDKSTRNAIERATQQARKLLDDDFSSQLEGTFDVLRSGVIAPSGGVHLSSRQQFQRGKIVAAIDHKRAAGMTALEAVADYVRDAAFTTLNRFIALKMLEARELVQECITKGEQSSGYREFCGMAPGIALIPNAAGYRLYVESLFDEFSTEIKVLFDRRDAASILWPKRQTFEGLLTILNSSELVGVWADDETIGWVYQFFNSGEERKKMRDESSAPRNSRELAVRNQFFTPRYVVQFLVDNTLGRVWLEMHGEPTRLTDLCEYLVHSADEPSRPRSRKDPRDLRILDPACGSGHFLLYSFDLLLAIYEEAWTADGPAPRSEVTGRTLREDYSELPDLRRAAPRLIVEHNLYGVDIDPRCAQIAALALWLRAQRAWKDLAVAASDRPTIQRTHIVVAEPMPSDPVLVDEFASRLDPPLLRDLFKKMVGESRLAGELGVLLRVEDAIASELHHAYEQFAKQRHTSGFLPGLEPEAQQNILDFSGIDDDQFFIEAESRIIEELRAFAESATGNASVRRRLFAGDSAQGIALIELVRTEFDIVLMNPPFGAGTTEGQSYLLAHDDVVYTELAAAMLSRGMNLAPSGRVGAITSATCLTLTRLSAWRCRDLVPHASLVIGLGLGVMDNAFVDASLLVVDLRQKSPNLLAINLEAAQDKTSALRSLNSSSSELKRTALISRDDLMALPEHRVIFGVPSAVLKLLCHPKSTFEPNVGTVRRGFVLFDLFRFVRLFWEVSPHNIGQERAWVWYSKGGEFLRFYAPVHLITLRADDGAEMRAVNLQKHGQTAQAMQGRKYYFRPGATFTSRSQKGFAARCLPAGCITSDSAAILSESDVSELFLVGWLNSRAVKLFIEMQVSAHKYEPGHIKSLPWPEHLDDLVVHGIESRTLQNTLLSVADSRWIEADPNFVFELSGQSIDEVFLKHTKSQNNTVTMIRRNLAETSRDIDKLYGVDTSEIDYALFGVHFDDEVPLRERKREDIAEGLVSRFFGLAIGRWNLQERGGVRPEENESAFDPFREQTVSTCNAVATKAECETAPFSDFVLVDDLGHVNDVAQRTWVSGAESSYLREDALRILGVAGDREGLRDFLAKKFFDTHLRAYSKSGRKAPLYWQLSIASARYSVWLYLHTITKDTLYKVQNEYVAPKFAHEERRLSALRQEMTQSSTSAQRKMLATQETLVDELRTFLEDVKRVAPLWNPNLDDGVIINCAPLWRLVAQHKPWQSELKTTWDELVAGEYEWARLAMHLWPERVVPKCADDRSLAIAHGLEDVFWIEGSDGKWTPRQTPKRSIDELVHERTSVAVKAALKSLLEAPAANTISRRGRARRGASSAEVGGAG